MAANSSKSDKVRGLKEAGVQIELLRAKWPAAFPKQGHLVRPLTGQAAKIISETLGWNSLYTRGVLSVWKSRSAYCRAILNDGVRYNLDGSPTPEEIGDVARQQAKQRLAAIAARAERERLKAASKETPAIAAE